jgi:hypothetical protein
MGEIVLLGAHAACDGAGKRYLFLAVNWSLLCLLVSKVALMPRQTLQHSKFFERESGVSSAVSILGSDNTFSTT